MGRYYGYSKESLDMLFAFLHVGLTWYIYHYMGKHKFATINLSHNNSHIQKQLISSLYTHCGSMQPPDLALVAQYVPVSDQLVPQRPEGVICLV